MKVCTKCDREVWARGLCGTHYTAARRAGELAKAQAPGLCRNNLHPVEGPGKCDECRREANRRDYVRYQEERKAKQRAYTAENREEVNARAKARREENPEKTKAQAKASRERHSEARREANREWHKANPKWRKDYAAAKRAENPEAVRAASRERYARERDKWLPRMKETNRAWKASNPEKVAEMQHRRRARKAAAGVFTITERELDRLYASPCAACGAVGDVHLDHVIPLARGGRHSIGNLQALCPACNMSKGAKLFIEWRAARAA